MMDINEIMKILPHRPPFLLIDKVEEIVEGEKIVAIKNVTMNEPYFVGHFPQLLLCFQWTSLKAKLHTSVV